MAVIFILCCPIICYNLNLCPVTLMMLMSGFVLQEYKPYMFWMNMIDAFYQSLVCFFIPYFVSLFLIISSSTLRTSLLLLFTHHLLLLLPFSPSFFPQAYADSDVDLFTWGTPITTLTLFTILLHLGIETKTWVRTLISDSLMKA